jgi:hypothetical protein
MVLIYLEAGRSCVPVPLHCTFALMLKDRHQSSFSVNVPQNLPPLPKTSSHDAIYY